MIYTKLTKMAMKICFYKHKDQVDKCGIPYPFHPFLIAQSMHDEATTCVALLHDIIEDTTVTATELIEMGFTDEIVEAVLILTHKSDVPYSDYIDKIKENKIARKVKIADLKHNTDLTRLDIITKQDLCRQKKYIEALKILNKYNDET